MVGFFLKKSFFDLWDNLLPSLLMNFAFLLLIAGTIGLVGLLNTTSALAFIFLAVGIVACFVYAGAVACAVREFGDYRSIGFKGFFASFKESWRAGLFLGIGFALVCLIVLIGIPFYVAFNSMIGLIAAALIFWTVVVLFLAMQYFFPLYSRLDHSIKKSVRKSFLVFFDNPGFSIVLFLYSTVMLAVSVPLAFLIPGFTGILLAQSDALKLRILKYDYLETNPEANRRKIPWTSLLYEERERVGPRTLRNFIFPWKY
jgi:uncharacterized membrane protein YesL